jgi:DNA-binding transcriptional LysR family regulator
MNRSDLDGLAVFLAVAEQRGFRAAAKQLGLTPSAVSQNIRSLERRLGAALFARTTRSVGLTEAGEQLLVHARPAAEMLQAGLDAARDLGERPSGLLRINAPRPTVALLIDRLLPEFHAAHPGIRLELFGEDERIDIVKHGFDAGIRLGHIVEVDMVSTWLTAPEPYVVVAAPALIAQHGRPKRPEDLQQRPAILIRRNGQVARSWELAKAGRAVHIGVDGPLIVNDYDAYLRAAVRGVGFAYVIRSMVSDELADGRLVAMLEDHARRVPGLSLYYPSRSQSLPKLRAFIAFATQRLRARPARRR